MRTATRLLSAVLALAFVVAATVAVVEIIRGLAGWSPWVAPVDEWYRTGRSTAWEDRSVRITLAGMAVAGLALVVFAAWPRPRRLLASEDLHGVTVFVERSRLERAAERRAERVHGVRRATVDLRRRGAVVDVRATAHADPAIGEPVQEVVAGTLAAARVPDAAGVSVRVRRAR